MRDVYLPEGFQGHWVGPEHCVLKCPQGHVAEGHERTARESVDVAARRLIVAARDNGCLDCGVVVVDFIVSQASTWLSLARARPRRMRSVA